MRLLSTLINSHFKTIEQKIMCLLQDSTKLHHLHQIHAIIVKTSLDHNNFILSKLLHRILSSPLSSNLPYARSLFDSIQFPDTFIWNTMIRAYLNSELPNKSLSLFVQMRLQEGVFIDSFSLSLVLQACGKSKDYQNGPTIHTQVLKIGFGVDLFVQTALIEMYAKFGFVNFAHKIFDEMNDPDLFCYAVLLAECVRAGEMDLAQDLFDNMPEKDIVSWSSMISGYAKSRQSNEALRLFHEMQLANVVPNKITMVSVLSACGDLGALDMGKMVHEFIERNGIETDMKLGTSLVDMYAKCGDINNAIRVFDWMSKRDVFAWSAMIVGLANHGYGEVALDYFSKMISEGIKPDDITFLGVLSACRHIGMVDKGWTYFNSMSGVYGINPKMAHYGSMVDILGRAGRLQEARKLISSMPFEPDVVVWRALLGACRIYKNVQLAEEATVKLLSLEPLGDGNYVLLSTIHLQAKEWDKVVNVRKMMKNKNIKKVPGSSSIEVGNAVHEFVAGDKSHPQSDEIYQMLAKMTRRLKYGGYEPLGA